jgi:hypothetical protein
VGLGYTFQIMQQKPVIEGLWKGTILGTVGDDHRHRPRA